MFLDDVWNKLPFCDGRKGSPRITYPYAPKARLAGTQERVGRCQASRPHQRTNARVSACHAGLGNHTSTKPLKHSLVGNCIGIHLHEYGLVDTLNDTSRVPLASICKAPRAPGAGRRRRWRSSTQHHESFTIKGPTCPTRRRHQSHDGGSELGSSPFQHAIAHSKRDPDPNRNPSHETRSRTLCERGKSRVQPL